MKKTINSVAHLMNNKPSDPYVVKVYANIRCMERWSCDCIEEAFFTASKFVTDNPHRKEAKVFNRAGDLISTFKPIGK